MLTKIFVLFRSTLPYLLVFFISLSYSFDPDLGWHLKYGEYFIQNGHILKENTFSSQMTDFIWPNGAWMGDVLLYLIFNNFGFFGLTIAGALVVTATFYFFGNAVKLSNTFKLLLFPFISYALLNINGSSFRGQQISLLLIGVLIYFLAKASKELQSSNKLPRKLYLLPLLFLLWANLHHQSLMGLGIFFLWVIISFFITSKKEFKYLALTFLASFALTFINPYGIGIYYDFLAHVTDSHVATVSEYKPFVVSSSDWWMLFLVSLAALFILIASYRKKVFKKILRIGFILSVFIVLSYFNRRFVWPAFYIFIPFAGLYLSGYETLARKIFPYAFGACLFIFILIFSAKISLLQNPEDWSSYCDRLRTPCSQKAAEFAVKNLKNKKIYTYYNWGGWLIWNYPQIKPSTDGRMHLWRDEKGFGAYEYDYNLEIGKESIALSEYDAVFIPKYKTALYKELARLTAKGKWRLVYEDEISLILVRSVK